MTPEELLAKAGELPEIEPPNRNDKYLPAIHMLTEKNYTTVQISDFFKCNGVTISKQYIGNKRRKHRKALSMAEETEAEGDEETPATGAIHPPTGLAPEDGQSRTGTTEPPTSMPQVEAREESEAEQILRERN